LTPSNLTCKIRKFHGKKETLIYGFYVHLICFPTLIIGHFYANVWNTPKLVINISEPYRKQSTYRERLFKPILMTDQFYKNMTEELSLGSCNIVPMVTTLTSDTTPH
jgi:hypothetical protein